MDPVILGLDVEVVGVHAAGHAVAQRNEPSHKGRAGNVIVIPGV